jgi:3-oxoacyl-[acyl-carrier-protein] synthase I
MNPVFLPALGLVSVFGADPARTLRQVLEGATAQMSPVAELLSGRSTLVGRVTAALPSVREDLAEFDCRNNRLALAALAQIEGAVQAAAETLGRNRVAVILGTSTSGIAEGEDAVLHHQNDGSAPAGFHYRQQEIGTIAEFVARTLGLDGIRYTISTACSSSAKALATGRRLIAAGLCDAAVVGGCDTLCRLTLNGFDALEAVSPGLSNPFSVNRDGINLGEGAAFFLMTRAEAEIALLGAGESSDGYHVSAPDPTGAGVIAAMEAALLDARLSKAQVGYLNLHGTGTIHNDAMEGKGVAAVLDDTIPCSATKPMTGHTLGAAGAVELGLCWLLLSQLNPGRKLPPHVWDGCADPGIPPIRLAGRGDTYEAPVMMSNSFAFGGSNVSLVLGNL